MKNLFLNKNCLLLNYYNTALIPFWFRKYDYTNYYTLPNIYTIENKIILKTNELMNDSDNNKIVLQFWLLIFNIFNIKFYVKYIKNYFVIKNKMKTKIIEMLLTTNYKKFYKFNFLNNLYFLYIEKILNKNFLKNTKKSNKKNIKIINYNCDINYFLKNDFAKLEINFLILNKNIWYEKINTIYIDFLFKNLNKT